MVKMANHSSMLTDYVCFSPHNCKEECFKLEDWKMSKDAKKLLPMLADTDSAKQRKISGVTALLFLDEEFSQQFYFQFW